MNSPMPSTVPLSQRGQPARADPFLRMAREQAADRRLELLLSVCIAERTRTD